MPTTARRRCPPDVTHRHDARPTPAPGQPHSSLRMEHKSLQLPDLASLSIADAYGCSHATQPPRPFSSLLCPFRVCLFCLSQLTTIMSSKWSTPTLEGPPVAVVKRVCLPQTSCRRRHGCRVSYPIAEAYFALKICWCQRCAHRQIEWMAMALNREMSGWFVIYRPPRVGVTSFELRGPNGERAGS
jgi:hypothetical protein